jgi:hypothetical protein
MLMAAIELIYANPNARRYATGSRASALIVSDELSSLSLISRGCDHRRAPLASRQLSAAEPEHGHSLARTAAAQLLRRPGASA